MLELFELFPAHTSQSPHYIETLNDRKSVALLISYRNYNNPRHTVRISYRYRFVVKPQSPTFIHRTITNFIHRTILASALPSTGPVIGQGTRNPTLRFRTIRRDIPAAEC